MFRLKRVFKKTLPFVTFHTISTSRHLPGQRKQTEVILLACNWNQAMTFKVQTKTQMMFMCNRSEMYRHLMTVLDVEISYIYFKFKQMLCPYRQKCLDNHNCESH